MDKEKSDESLKNLSCRITVRFTSEDRSRILEKSKKLERRPSDLIRTATEDFLDFLSD